MAGDTPLSLVAAERLRRIFGEPNPDDTRIALVATQADAERLHRLSMAANRHFLILTTNPAQKPAMTDGGSLRALLGEIAAEGRRIHDPRPAGSQPMAATSRLWRPDINPTRLPDEHDRRLNRPLEPGDMKHDAWVDLLSADETLRHA